MELRLLALACTMTVRREYLVNGAAACLGVHHIHGFDLLLAHTLHHGLEGVVLRQQLRHLLTWMVHASESASLAEATTRAAASHWAPRGRTAPPACGAPPRANSASLREAGVASCEALPRSMLPCHSPSSRAAGGRRPCQVRCHRHRRRRRRAPPGWPESRRSRKWTMPAASAHQPGCVSRLEASWPVRAAAPRESAGAQARSHAVAPRQHQLNSPPAALPTARAARTPRPFSCPRHTSRRPAG